MAGSWMRVRLKGRGTNRNMYKCQFKEERDGSPEGDALLIERITASVAQALAELREFEAEVGEGSSDAYSLL